MRYNIRQQALLKQAFDIVALALANSPVTDAADSVDHIKTTATSSSPASEFFAQLPYEQSQHTVGAVTDSMPEQSQVIAAQPVIAAQVVTAPERTARAQNFFAGLPWDLDNQATHDVITTQPAIVSQVAAGDWFSRIEWQSSNGAHSDVQSFAHLATSTALHTASRAISSVKH